VSTTKQRFEREDASVTNKLFFPEGFLWGVSASAYQIEGAVDEDGRSPSIWDTFSHRPGATRHGDTGDIACDHYHRMQADVALMAELGVGAYRFSVAWNRVQPDGKTVVNEAGLGFYNRLVDTLLAHDIRPVVTLYHWELPQSLEDEGGWLERETARRFAAFAEIVAGSLGDRVELWVTLNEPWCSAFVGYSMGHHAPGLAEIGAGAIASHNLLLAHGMAARAIAASAGAGAQIGSALNISPVSAASVRPEDVAAARRVDDQRNRWFLDPLFKGCYPSELLEEYTRLVGRDFVQDGDYEIMRTGVDFLGVNYYSPQRVAAAKDDRSASTGRSTYGAWLGVDDRSRDDVPRTAMGWTVEPEGLTEILVRVRRDYGDVAMYVTENGASFHDYVDPNGTVCDFERIEYLRAHLAAAHAAISQGVDLRGYLLWSLYDNFEWAEGYGQRFGLAFTDYRTQERIFKQSAHWYKAVMAANAVEL
jgi:beta-glucosidase